MFCHQGNKGEVTRKNGKDQQNQGQINDHKNRACQIQINKFIFLCQEYLLSDRTHSTNHTLQLQVCFQSWAPILYMQIKSRDTVPGILNTTHFLRGTLSAVLEY